MMKKIDISDLARLFPPPTKAMPERALYLRLTPRAKNQPLPWVDVPEMIIFGSLSRAKSLFTPDAQSEGDKRDDEGIVQIFRQMQNDPEFVWFNPVTLDGGDMKLSFRLEYRLSEGLLNRLLLEADSKMAAKRSARLFSNLDALDSLFWERDEFGGYWVRVKCAASLSGQLIVNLFALKHIVKVIIGETIDDFDIDAQLAWMRAAIDLNRENALKQKLEKRSAET